MAEAANSCQLCALRLVTYPDPFACRLSSYISERPIDHGAEGDEGVPRLVPYRGVILPRMSQVSLLSFPGASKHLERTDETAEVPGKGPHHKALESGCSSHVTGGSGCAAHERKEGRRLAGQRVPYALQRDSQLKGRQVMPPRRTMAVRFRFSLLEMHTLCRPELPESLALTPCPPGLPTQGDRIIESKRYGMTSHVTGGYSAPQKNTSLTMKGSMRARQAVQLVCCNDVCNRHAPICPGLANSPCSHPSSPVRWEAEYGVSRFTPNQFSPNLFNHCFLLPLALFSHRPLNSFPTPRTRINFPTRRRRPPDRPTQRVRA